MPFLLVDQRERILVEKPTSWRMEESAEQRNAASRFFDFLGEHLQSLGFKSTLLLPSLFRHTERKLMVCSQPQGSLTFWASTFSHWVSKARCYFQACLGTQKESSWFALMWTTSSCAVRKKIWNGS